MARNIEIKARAHQFDALRERAAALASEAPLIFRQQDFFYDVPTGRLKLRQFDDGTPSELIFYQRDDRDGPKVSYYSRSPVTNPEAMHALLAQALTTRGIVSKNWSGARASTSTGSTASAISSNWKCCWDRTTTKSAARRKRTRCSRAWAWRRATWCRSRLCRSAGSARLITLADHPRGGRAVAVRCA